MLLTAKFQNKTTYPKSQLLEENEINKNKFTLTDISSLLNTSRKVLWKKIIFEDNNFYLILNEAYSSLKLQMFKNENGYYTTSENLEKLKLFIKENEDFLDKHLPFKEGICEINTMRNNLYKNIKENKLKFIKNNSLFIIPLVISNSMLYLKKEDILEANKTNSSFKYYNKKSILSLLEKISYDKKLTKIISKNKFSSFSFELKFEDINIIITSENFNGQHFFSKRTIEAAYFFVNEVKRKTENLILLNKTKKEIKKFFSDCPYRLCSKEKKISVSLHKINNTFYYSIEDKEKIEKLFN
jgi:hypothetical protein